VPLVAHRRLHIDFQKIQNANVRVCENFPCDFMLLPLKNWVLINKLQQIRVLVRISDNFCASYSLQQLPQGLPGALKCQCESL